jgi:hypothetical protein
MCFFKGKITKTKKEARRRWVWLARLAFVPFRKTLLAGPNFILM